MTDSENSFSSVIASARAWLEAEAAMGGIGIPVPQTAPPPEANTDRARRLHLLAERAATCTDCALHQSRTKSVFARGSQVAELAFVGDGPGREEETAGEPFVGAVGQLLDKMVAAMGYRPNEVYLCNLVKCRSHEDRSPLPNQAVACRSLLSPQLEIVAPKVIVALGRCAAIHLGVAGETGPWRGIWREWRGTAVMSTHHPADVLRTPEHRREVWEDLQLVMSRLGRALPPKSGT